MKNLLISAFLIGALPALIASCGTGENTSKVVDDTTFYEVPLVCGAAPEIGCGSRIKPLFLDTEKFKEIKESWSNRPGTIIAVVWNGDANTKLIDSLFKCHGIDAKLIVDDKEIEKKIASMTGGDKWYKGMEIDQLSLEEAGVIAETMTGFAADKGLINDQEATAIKTDIEEYFKKELVIVRTCEELKSEETQEKWRVDNWEIYVKHIGRIRADSVSVAYEKFQEETCKKESACTNGEKACCKKKED